MTREDRLALLRIAGIDVQAFENSGVLRFANAPQNDSVNVGVTRVGTGRITNDLRSGVSSRPRVRFADAMSNELFTIEFPNDTVETNINNSGYVFNRFVDRRFVPAQVFHMLRSNRNLDDGFNDALNRKGYMYSWKVLLHEFEVLQRMANTPDNNFRIRRTFYTRETFTLMLSDYLRKLRFYVNSLPIHKCRGVEYKRIRRYGNVFLRDIDRVLYKPVRDLIISVNNILCDNYSCGYYKVLRACVKRFIDTMMVRLDDNTLAASAFKEAYKGAGAYYTLDSMIKFHGCLMRDCTNTEESLEKLEEMRSERQDEYWKLFGVLKDVINFNNFDLFSSIARSRR